MSTPGPKKLDNNEELYIPENLEELLVLFYKKNNPENANNIPTILAKYHGKERSLFNKLLVKYHEDPWPRSKPTESVAVSEETPADVQVPSRDTILYHVNKKVDELNANLVKSEALIEKQKQELKMKDEQIDQNCQQIEELLLSVETMKGHNKEIQSQLDEKSSQLSSLQTQFDELTSKYQTLQQENKQLANDTHTSQPTQLQTEEVTVLKEQIASLQRQLSQKQNGMKSILSLEYQQMRKNLDEVESQRDEFERVNSDLSLRIQQLEHELQKCKQRVETEKSDENEHMSTIMKRNEELEIEVVHLKKELEVEKKQLTCSLEEKVEELLNSNIEREGLVKQVDIMQQEKESMMTENIELKSQQEQLQTWIEEERNHNEILQSEIQKKVQEGFEIEEERNVLQGVVKEIQQELRDLKEEYQILQEKCEMTVKENEILKEENELIKRNTMEVNEQLSDSLIQKLQSTVDITSDKQPSLPVVSAAVDASAFTLKSFLEFIETVLSGVRDVLVTTDLDRSIMQASVKSIQELLLDRVILIRNLITVGIVEKPWDPKDEVAACHNCHCQFGMVNRKHHCRFCGQAVCSNCSDKSITFPGTQEKKRVCDECFIVFDRLQGLMKDLK